ncbi:MAG: HDOD domain-containing protein, partial [Chromatiales bacterium]|nr:HDOD domain-containing protein [Chromatiales bacterium]
MTLNRQSEELKQSLLRSATLPSLPGVLIRIYERLDQPSTTIDDIAQLLETDSGLTARALHLGNSALYGAATQREITNVTDVMVRIGPFDLWSLLMATEVKSLFYGISTQLMDMNH